MNLTTPSYKLANLCQLVAFQHEDNYDWEQHLVDLDKALKEQREADLRGEDHAHLLGIRETYNRNTLRETSERVCKEQNEADLALPIYLLLSYTWNDTLDWAKRVTGKDVEPSKWIAEWERRMEETYKKYPSKFNKVSS